MKKTIWILPTVLFMFCLAGCEKAPHHEVKQYTIEQFMNTTAIFGSSFSFDEQRIIFSSDESGIFNAYTVPAGGGARVQMTFSEDDAVFAPVFFPGDNRFLYLSDQGGNEIWHIFLREEDGSVKELTPGENVRAMFYQWAYDDRSFFYGSNERDPKFMDIYEMDIETFTPEMIYQNDEGFSLGDISNNKRYLGLSKKHTNHDSDMYLYDRETRESLHLSPHEGDINYSPMMFGMDSKSLYYLTDKGSEFTYLMQYDIESGASDRIAESEWDILYAYLSRNGRYLVTGINRDARTEIKILDTTTSQYVELPELPDGDITSVNVSRSEKRISFYLSGSKSPNNLYVYDFDTKVAGRLTDTMNPEINPEDLVSSQVVRYPSFDGLEIPAILYKPLQIEPGEKAPALVWVHGGPGGQSRIGYSGFLQYLVNHGYVIIAVNNRGSVGYGKTFYKLDDMKHGEDDLYDCVEAMKYLESTGYVEGSKIGILGGSYGGYMVLAALTYRPEAFAVGVDLFGISNWVRTLKSIPPWWESQRKALYEEMGNPETDEEYLHRISPLFHAEKITKPLMVLQGANDPRVLKAESDEIVEAVRKNGLPVEYIIFEDEGHGFLKKENRMKGYRAILDFLDKYLKEEDKS